ncbi:MAG TPA: MFS transporter, partial [Rhabdochlamydiaceae bacterium]
MNIFGWLKPPPHIAEIQDQDVVKKNYKYWRMRIFLGMYVGYIFYYFTRKSFTFAMPAMMTELGFDKSDIGILASVLSISYGVSKFVSGVMADRSNPRYLMGFGLILTGLFNIFFGLSSSVLVFAIFWGLNGWFQGWGWPPCNRLLTHWYSQKERGRWWGAWNTSHSVGGALIPIIVAVCVQMFGWRFAMFVPGVMCIGVGFFLLNRLRDTPQSLGLPPIEKFKDDYPRGKKLEESELSVKEIILKHVITNKYIWILSASYFFLYVVRTAVNDWTLLYFVQTKGYSYLVAGACVFWFEIGGFCGSLVAGWASDKIFDGRRGPVSILFCF